MSESLVTALTLPIWTYVMQNVPLFLESEKLFRKMRYVLSPIHV